MRDAIFVSGDQASAYPAVVGLLAFVVEQARRDQALNEPAENVSDRLDNRGRDACGRSCFPSEHVALLELPTPLTHALGEPTGRKSNTSSSCSKDFQVQAALAVGDKSEHRSYRIISSGGAPWAGSHSKSAVSQRAAYFRVLHHSTLRRAEDARARAAWRSADRVRRHSRVRHRAHTGRSSGKPRRRPHEITHPRIQGLASGQLVSNHRRRRG